jgi:hypothetical protein
LGFAAVNGMGLYMALALAKALSYYEMMIDSGYGKIIFLIMHFTSRSAFDTL